MRRLPIFLSLWALPLLCLGIGVQTPTSPEDVVREQIRALVAGDLAGLLAMFSPGAAVFDLPEDTDRLVGKRSETAGTHEQRLSFFRTTLARSPRPSAHIVETLRVGDLAAVTLRTSDSPTTPKPTFLLSVYRVRNGRIDALWHIARTDTTPMAASDLQGVIRQLIVANNTANVEAFLALFSPASKYFRGSDDPQGIADKMSERMSHQDSRRAAITAAFASGSPGQVTIVGILALGDLVVSHDRVVLTTGAIIDQMKIYRVRNGVITHDWTAHEQVRLP